MVIVPPGTVALPLAPFAIDVLVESKVASWVEQLLTAQTWKVTLPLSFGSGSLNVAVRVGVAVLSCAVSAGETSAGVDGAMFAVLFVTETPVDRRGGVAGRGGGVANHRVAARLRVVEAQGVEVVDGAREREPRLVASGS